MLYGDVVSQKHLKNLVHYKYSSLDLSPIANYILQPYWRWATTLFPLWLAPNLITLIGFLFVVGNFGLSWYYSPDLVQECPSWVYFSFAIGIWMYSTCDNVDGKQARRTNSSSPLGEVFDHGIDALNCSTGGILQACTIGYGFGFETCLVVCLATTAFFFSTWETFYTQQLYLGYINGPTEGLLIAIVSMIVSGVYGPQFWKTRLDEFISLPKELGEIELGMACVYGMLLLLVTTQVPVSVYRALKACERRKMSKKQALLNTIPYLLFLSGFVGWVLSPYSISNKIGYLMYMCLGVSVGRICAIIIVQHVTHAPYPQFKFIYVPFVVGGLLSWSPYFGFQFWTPQLEHALIHLLFAYLLVEYCLFISTVINQFCSHLGIQCLRIPYPPKKHKQEVEKEEMHDQMTEITAQVEFTDPIASRTRSRRSKR
ncbi:CDP-alcohol phosphatidyltransferase-domain-containing protein [Gorgonomyces haynaldii]|nr:CDP-alcohol phosphatidyltransferase-domain-containing protein [Gorgonomyces haynaldii]